MIKTIKRLYFEENHPTLWNLTCDAIAITCIAFVVYAVVVLDVFFLF